MNTVIIHAPFVSLLGVVLGALAAGALVWLVLWRLAAVLGADADAPDVVQVVVFVLVILRWPLALLALGLVGYHLALIA